MHESNIARKLLITGRVQGVGMRAHIFHHAKQLGVDGFVRNRRDGSVEAILSGNAQNIDKVIELTKQGTPAARIDNIEITEAQGIVEVGFKQLPTV